MIDPRQTVASIVAEHPSCAQVLVDRRIDFCCRGQLTLEAACAGRGLGTAAVLAELEQVIAGRARGEPERRSLATPTLVAHLVEQHDRALRQVMPTTRLLAAKVARVHGDHDPRLRTLAVAVADLEELLVRHLDTEEEVLYPAALAETPDPALVGRALATMREDHLAIDVLLERIREAAADFTLPTWACNSYRALFAELASLEVELFELVHVEDHVLAPRLISPAA